MKFVALLIFAVVGTFCSPNELIAIEALDPSLLDSLIDRFDVRGVYGVEPSFALVHSTFLELPRTLHDQASAVGLGSISSKQVLVVENNRGFDPAWIKAFQSCSAFARIHCIGDACVAIFDEADEPYLLGCIPSTSEIVALPSSRMNRPYSEAAEEEEGPYQLTEGTNQVIEGLVKQVDTARLSDSLTQLTKIHTRHSQSSGAVTAADFIFQYFTKLGLNATRLPFRNGYAPNVVAELLGTNPSKMVVVGAHFDCRAQILIDTNARAPGANDDGSGTAAVMEIARVFISSGVKFPYTIKFATFSGEEQGLYGSINYADKLNSEKANIVAMLALDMLGYQSKSYLGLEFSTRYTTVSLTNDMGKVSQKYVPGLNVGKNDGCCSDNRRFFELGFPTVKYGHAGGATSDPFYHHSNDTMNRSGFNLNLVKMITQSALSAVATLSGL